MWPFLNSLLETGGLTALAVVALGFSALATVKILWTQHIELLRRMQSEIDSLRSELSKERTRNEELHDKRHDEMRDVVDRMTNALSSIDRSLEKQAWLNNLLQGALHRGQ